MKKIIFIITFLCIQFVTAQTEWILDANKSDDFNSGSLNTSLWATKYPYTWPNGGFPQDRLHDQVDINTDPNPEHQIYLDNNVLFEVDPNNSSNKYLVLRAKEETVYYNEDRQIQVGGSVPSGWTNYYTENYSSGMIHSKTTYQYGKFEARIKVPNGRGFWPAYWLFGGTCELDIFEFMNDATATLPNRMSNKVYINHHAWLNGATEYSCGVAYPDDVDYSLDFHVYTMEWTPNYVKFLIDNKIKWMFNNTSGYFPTCQMDVIFNFAIQGKTGGIDYSPDNDTPFPSDVLIDYFNYYTIGNCDSYVLCDNNTSTSYQGFDIDVAVPKDIDYNGVQEENWSGSPYKYTCGKEISQNESLVLSASNSITLHPGFTAETGSDFLAEIISSCSSAQRLFNYSEDEISDVEDVKGGVSSSTFILFPNPISDRFNVEIKTTTSINENINNRIVIYDLLGQELFNKNFMTNKFEVNIENLPEGIYFVNISNGRNIIYNSKILKK